MTTTGADGAVVLGPRLGAGREAEVYAWGDRAVLKLYRPGFGGHRAEAAVLRSLDGEGLAPRLLDVVDRDARTGLVLERVGGPDMLTVLQRQPWRMLGLARALGTAHRAVHRVAAPAHVPDLRQVLAARIHEADLPPTPHAFVMRVLDGLPDGDRLCHGDYHPGNVLVTAGRTAVIDWVGATRGVPEGDHAHAAAAALGRPAAGHPVALPRLDQHRTIPARPPLREGVPARNSAPSAGAVLAARPRGGAVGRRHPGRRCAAAQPA